MTGTDNLWIMESFLVLGSSKDQTGTFSGKPFSIDLTISLPKKVQQIN